MRAALLEGVDDLRVVDDVEIDKPGEGEVLVRVRHCGVRHSDLHFVDGSLPCAFPSILGHEAGGTIEAVGAGVTGLAEGDTVILTLRPPCGRCYFCARGRLSLCPQCANMAGTLPDGATRLAHQDRVVSRAGVFLAAFAEQAVLPANGAVKVPDDPPGSTSPPSSAAPSRRPGGTAVMVGVPKMDPFLNIHALLFAMSEKKLTGCFLGSSNPHREFPRLLDLWRVGKLDLEGMVTSRRPLAEIGEAFADMKAGKGLRTVIDL